MKVVGLISGGKDSCYNLIQCIAAGHTIEALANLAPKYVDELDSYMYQSVGHMGIESYADAMNLPLYRRDIEGTSLNTESIDYLPTEGDEVEDLYSLLKKVKMECNIEAVSVGAVFSDYQRVRVENVCQRLGLVSLSYMWRRDQSELLNEMIYCGLEAILIKVAAIGLTPALHLGKSIKEMQPHLEKLSEKFSMNVCGEGGEYETFTLDCPLFKKKIVIDETELIETPGDVGYLNFKSLKLIDKDLGEEVVPNCELMRRMQIRSPTDYLQDIVLQEEANQPIGYDVGFHDECIREDLKEATIGGINGLFWTSVNSSSVRGAMDNLTKILRDEGLSLDQIVSVKMFVKSMRNYAQYNKEYNDYFSVNPPTRTCVEVPLEDPVVISLEILAWNECTSSKAVENSSVSDSDRLRRQTLHVQSISHWAPANIGPYSQAVKIGDLILVAGMIGLVPGTLEVAQGGIAVQSRLAFRHIGRVLAAMAPQADIRSIVQGVCYITDLQDMSVAKRLMTELNKLIITIYVVVPALPKGVNIEWQTWAHLSNVKFLYEECDYNLSDVNITLRKRYSSNESVCALIATASNKNPVTLTQQILEAIIVSCLRKVDSSGASDSPVNMTLYYKSSAVPFLLISEALKICPLNVATCSVPVSAIEDNATFISVVLIKL